MCGIIGYVGKQPCVQIIFDGLKKLEYRGYDSTGIATLDNREIRLIKSEGKLARLEALLDALPQTATVGLGHTRWATHGPPTTENAHPHVIESLAIVHNGIIENYRDLKSGLEAAGAKFKSQTDTEVVLHLLAEDVKRHKDDMRGAIISLLGKLKGAYSLGILVPSEPDTIYLVKQGSPLVIGLGEGETFFASDISALVSHTQKAIVLKDGQCAAIRPQGVELWDFAGNDLEQEITELHWSADAIEKAGFAHYMLKEIHEQPAVIAKAISRFLDLETGELRLAEMGIDRIDWTKIDQVHVVGCGTAFLSGMTYKYLLEPHARVPVNIELASEFRYRQPYLTNRSLVIAVSQSGETADTLASVKHARERGAQVLSICNARHTEIPRQSNATLFMECGPEIGVASTKAFTAMVFSHFFVAWAATEARGHAMPWSRAEMLDGLRTLPHHMQNLISHEERFKELAGKYCEVSHFLYLGRGTNYSIALEGALKLKEISYIHAEGYAAGELKHGPIALVDRFMPIMALAPRDEYYDKTIANIEEVKAREGRVIGVGADDDEQLAALCDDVIGCPQVGIPPLQTILNVIPLQLFSYYVALLRGTDVDQPRNLAKSVTVE